MISILYGFGRSGRRRAGIRAGCPTAGTTAADRCDAGSGTAGCSRSSDDLLIQKRARARVAFLHSGRADQPDPVQVSNPRYGFKAEPIRFVTGPVRKKLKKKTKKKKKK